MTEHWWGRLCTSAGNAYGKVGFRVLGFTIYIQNRRHPLVCDDCPDLGKRAHAGNERRSEDDLLIEILSVGVRLNLRHCLFRMVFFIPYRSFDEAVQSKRARLW